MTKKSEKVTILTGARVANLQDILKGLDAMQNEDSGWDIEEVEIIENEDCADFRVTYCFGC